MDYIEFRCGRCNKLLGKIKGEAEVKCSRCNSLNVLIGSLVSVCAPEAAACTVEKGSRKETENLHATRL